MKNLLIETRVGGQYADIIPRVFRRRNKNVSFLFDDNCLLLDITIPKSESFKLKFIQFVVIFPFSYDFLISSGRQQHGSTGYMNLVSIFFKNKFKNSNLKFMRASVVDSRYKIKNKKYIFFGLNFDGYFEEDEQKEAFREFFKSFSASFKESSKQLKIHISDKNPNRYKLIR